MYDWLDGALRESAEVVTASRRLARTLSEAYGKQRIEGGALSWETPGIRSLAGWTSSLLSAPIDVSGLPIRISPLQSKVLWERSLQRQLDDSLLNVSMLARQAQESWHRLHEFAVPIDECVDAAQGRDQHVFARAAQDYRSRLREEGWIDDAMVPQLLTHLVEESRLPLPGRISFAGFDRVVPQLAELVRALASAGVRVEFINSATGNSQDEIRHFDNSDAELRAAGAWARRALEANPVTRVGIVVTNLENDAPRAARLVREGAVPGWQFGGSAHVAAVNVSYGRRLSQYPACAIAIQLLGWLYLDLSSRDISLLLRAAWFGKAEAGVRSRLEMHLRRVPERRWTPESLAREFSGVEHGAGWAAAMKSLTEKRSRLPRRDSPAAWARVFHDVLEAFRWPGEQPTDSNEYQLVNRWRELLNELAALELVSPSMTLAEAHRRLANLASDVIFQAEAGRSAVQLLGPLEAAGICFDKIWIAGLTASAWPPAGRPLALVSRALQRKYRMPDADPQDTLEFSRRVLSRVMGSADSCVCSYALTDGDAQQTATNLIGNVRQAGEQSGDDAGWFAASLVNSTRTMLAASDPVPPVAGDEIVRGGAAALQWQVEDPFSAFVQARLGVQPLPPIAPGLSAAFRGTFIHDALRALYQELPCRDELREWSGAEKDRRIRAALSHTLTRHGRNADSVLAGLLALEAERVGRLLSLVVEMDSKRNNFNISKLESTFNVNIEGLRLQLRVDRIDRLEDGSSIIVDYKTGAPKTFLKRSGQPQDVQLVVYACAIDDPVSDLALVNVDSRGVNISGAGRTLTPDLDWDATLADWQRLVADAGRDMCRGDVRIFASISHRGMRPLAALSRVAEMRDEG